MGTTSREASWTNVSTGQQPGRYEAYHASAWKRVPTESNAITVLNFAPLVFKSFIVHISSATSTNQ